jgi:hypothetical protein
MTEFNADCDFGHPTATVRRSVNGAHIRFPNGWTVSVQWGPGTYSSNHGSLHSAMTAAPLSATEAEIAAWLNGGDMVEWGDSGTVQGWQTWEQVQAVLDLAERGELPVEVTADD